MWKAVIKIMAATIGVFAIVLAGTAMLIEASTVDVASSRDKATASCRAPRQLSLPRAPLLLQNNSSTAPDARRNYPHVLLAHRASLEGR